MLLERKQIEVGRNRSKNGGKINEEEPASFSLAVLIVLLQKYSSRLLEEIQLNVQNNGRVSNVKKELRYSLDGEHTFLSILQKVKKDLQALRGARGGLDIEWVTDADQIGLKNRIRLSPGIDNLYNAVFSSDPHSFYHSLFRKAARHYKILAESALAMLNRPIADLEYYSGEDVKEINSVAYGQIDKNISSSDFLDRIFDRTANEYPNRPAVTFGNKSVSYLSLKKRVIQLANALTRLGVNPGDNVGILLDRSAENYEAMLAIMKCGAAYVPIDPDCPGERIKFILEDSSAQFLISDSSFVNSYALYQGDVLNTDIELLAAMSEWDHDVLDNSKPINRSTTDPAYIIYTSGSTGQPKGVVVSHGAASNLIKAEKAIFDVKPNDKVVQGFSTAFDASIEEIWLAFASGASLYPVDKEIMRSGADLSEFINRERITVFSTVPTLLSMMQPPLPSLRLVILGGETCTLELINHWYHKKLRIVNTYGPTESTVITTTSDCEPNKKITIGKPIPNCAAFITDSSLTPVPPGVPGELCIAGFGLANGYQNRNEITEKKFVTPSFNLLKTFPQRIYRSGDLARVNEDGNIEFLGRIDSQIKLRGYRIELAEIESQLSSLPNIKQAVVAVRKDEIKGDVLIAYIVLAEKSKPFHETTARQILRKRLADYMIPQFFVEQDVLPLLPSGKIDRKKISEINSDNLQEKRISTEPLKGTEQSIFDVWSKYFPHKQILKKDDFFLDLGGHSLLAARTVSELRQQPPFKKLSVLDVYNNRSIEKLAKQFTSSERVNGAHQTNGATNKSANKANTARHFFCGLMQFFSLYFVFGFNLMRDLPLFGVFFYLYYNGHSVGNAIGWAVVCSTISYPLTIILAVATKWLLLGRIKAGRYRLWGGFYFRWWFVRKLFQIVDLHHLAGTPLLSSVYSMLGMNIGEGVHLETSHFAAFDLITIGGGSSIDEGAMVNGFSVKNRWLTIGEIKIGSNCFVGARSVLCENTVMEDGARLEDLSLIPTETKIPAGETWCGSPARRTSKINCAEVVNPPVFSEFHKYGVSALYCLLISLIPVMAALAFVPGVFLLIQFDPINEFWNYVALLPVVGASFVLLLAVEIAVLKWVLVGKVKQGIYAVHGSFYIRNWIVDQLLRTGLDHVGQLHATLYSPIWYRMLGMDIGSGVELSTAASTTPDLIHLDDGSTIADEVSLGSPHIEKGWMVLAPVHMGVRSFAGNSAVIPVGTKIGDHSLIGVLSVAPKREDAIMPHATWFGSPPLLFPRRESSSGYSEQKTYQPPRKLRMMRAAFELLRLTMPPALFIIIMSTMITAGLMLLELVGPIKTLLALPVIFGLCCIVTLTFVALTKWTVVGRYKPFNRPLWTNFVWRLEFVNALFEFFASPLLLNLLQGTPFLAWYLRLIGAKIGKACYIDTTGFLEWDLVKVGDRAVINQDAVMQTHLFEDRVLKASHVKVGNDCTIGTTCVVLYDSELKDGSHLNDLSLLMKGEILPEQTQWIGIPAIESGTLIAKQRTGRQLYKHESIAI